MQAKSVLPLTKPLLIQLLHPYAGWDFGIKPLLIR